MLEQLEQEASVRHFPEWFVVVSDGRGYSVRAGDSEDAAFLVAEHLGFPCRSEDDWFEMMRFRHKYTCTEIALPNGLRVTGHSPSDYAAQGRQTVNEWSGCSSRSLSLIYHSVEPAEFNEPTKEMWESILVEIGEELDRRRLGTDWALGQSEGVVIPLNHAAWSRGAGIRTRDL